MFECWCFVTFVAFEGISQNILEIVSDTRISFEGYDEDSRASRSDDARTPRTG